MVSRVLELFGMEKGLIYFHERPDLVHATMERVTDFYYKYYEATLAAAEGDYVAYLDDDDEWQPRRIERQMMRLGELSSALIGRCRRIRRLDLELVLDRRTAYGWRPYEPGVAPAFDSPIDPPDIDGSVPF